MLSSLFLLVALLSLLLLVLAELCARTMAMMQVSAHVSRRDAMLIFVGALRMHYVYRWRMSNTYLAGGRSMLGSGGYAYAQSRLDVLNRRDVEKEACARSAYAHCRGACSK